MIWTLPQRKPDVYLGSGWLVKYESKKNVVVIKYIKFLLFILLCDWSKGKFVIFLVDSAGLLPTE